MTVQTLTLEGVKAAARKAYDAGKLTAQHPDKFMRLCVYEIDGTDFGCAIGVALTKATKARIRANGRNSGCGVPGLAAFSMVKVADEDLSPLNTIQGAHDVWARETVEGTPDDIEYCRKRFLDLIDYPATKA